MNPIIVIKEANKNDFQNKCKLKIKQGYEISSTNISFIQQTEVHPPYSLYHAILIFKKKEEESQTLTNKCIKGTLNNTNFSIKRDIYDIFYGEIKKIENYFNTQIEVDTVISDLKNYIKEIIETSNSRNNLINTLKNIINTIHNKIRYTHGLDFEKISETIVREQETSLREIYKITDINKIKGL